MKRILLIVALVALCFTSCYEDLGNYDYNPIAPIELSGFESEYTVYSMIDQLDIVPQFAEKENSDCVWTLFLNGLPQAKVDTLSTEPDLHHKVVESSGSYTLALTIENRKTGDRQVFQSTITIQTEFSSGCYILKEVDGKTDVDLITSKQALAENILDVNNTRLEGSPRSFIVCPDINYVTEEGEPQERVKTVWITSDKDARMLSLETMRPVYDLQSMFYDVQPDESPRNMALTANNLVYFSNNGCYNCALLIPTAMHKFGYPMEVKNSTSGESKTCSCAKYLVNSTSYSMFYDEQNERFLIAQYGNLNHFSNYDRYYRPTYSPNNMNSDLLYMGKMAWWGYALMYDKTAQQHVIYKLETLRYESYGAELCSPLLEKKVVSESAQLLKGETFGHNLNSTFFYYSIGNTLNMFSYDTMQEQSDILPGLEGKISMIKHLQGYNATGQRYEYLAVATSLNGRYKLYFCPMLAGKPDLTKEAKIVEGEGAPVDLYIL